MSSSIFLIPPSSVNSSPQTSFTLIESLIENKSISKYTSISQLTSYFTYNNSTIYELEFSSISVFDFISKIYSIFPTLKTIPSNQVRSLIIKGINILVPLIDVFTVLMRTTPEVKKVVQAHHPNCPGINQGIFLVEYLSHESAMKALEIINAKKKLNVIKGNIEAFVAEPLKDNLKKIMQDECTVLSFENLNANIIKVPEFKSYIEKFLNEKNEVKIKIKKIRQYSTRILIEFDQFPKCFESYLERRINGHYLMYKNRNIVIKPMMKPCVNLGKYKERNIKLSSYSLSEEDRNIIFQKFENGLKITNDDLNLKKKAEAIVNMFVQEEKREFEREKDDYSSRINRKRERESSGSNKRKSSHNYSSRKNEDNQRIYEKPKNSPTVNNIPPGGNIDWNSLPQNNSLHQFLQLLSNPNFNINLLASVVAGTSNNQQINKPTSIPTSHLNSQPQPSIPSSSNPPIAPNTQNQQGPPNITSFLNQPALSYLISNPNLFQYYSNEQNQTTSPNQGISSSNPQPLSVQQSQNEQNSNPQISLPYNPPMLHFSKLIPGNMGTLPPEMLQPLFMPPPQQNGKNYYSLPPNQTQPQSFSFPLEGGMNLYPFQNLPNQNIEPNVSSQNTQNK